MAKKKVELAKPAKPKSVKVEIVKPFKGKLQADKEYEFDVPRQDLKNGKKFVFDVPPFVAEWIKSKGVC